MTEKASRSPWLAVDPGVDPIGWARILHRAHGLALRDGTAPSVLRSVVASSWRRAAERGVDPDACAPTILSESETERALHDHPVAHLLPLVTKLLAEATEDARYFAVLSDAEGVLLWVDGHSEALETAAGPGFLPGHLCSEAAVGTNAVGTAIELDHPVQIFSAEHFNRRLHGLTCSAAPIRDPETRDTIGVLNLSGNFRTGHPHSLPLVTAVARVVEDALRRELAAREDRLRAAYIELVAERRWERSALVTRAGRVLAASPRGWLGSKLRRRKDGSFALPDGVEVAPEPIGKPGEALLVRAAERRPPHPAPAISIRALGPRRAEITIGPWRTELSPRHSEIVILLALHPEGLSADQLLALTPGASRKAVTVRAEVSRLRRLLGPALASNPYRLVGFVDADRAALERSLLAVPLASR